MSEVEPAWRAELRKDILAAAIAVNTAYRRGEVQPWTPMTDAVMSALEPHIQAAEQRGRKAAVKDHVDGLKAEWARFRGHVLHEVWMAMRDAKGGPLIDAMSVVNGLMDKS